MQVWWGPNLTMLYNDAYIPFLGRGVGEEQGKHPSALGRSAPEIWAEIWHQIGPMLEQVLSDGSASWSEDIQMFFNRKKPREEVYASFSFSPIFPVGGGPGDKVQGTFCACTEVTEKVLGARQIAGLNDQLRARVEELQTLLDLLPVGVFVAQDPACTNITANLAGAALLAIAEGANASKTGPEGERLPFRVQKDGVEICSDDLPMQRAARLGVTIAGETLDIVRADGRVVSLYEYAAPLFDDGGLVRGSLGAFVDITQLKDAEQKVRARTEQFETLFNLAPICVYLVDADFRISQVNIRSLPMFGDVPDLVGRDFDEVSHSLWPKAYADELVRRIRHTLQTGKHYAAPEPWELRLDGGEALHYEWQIGRIRLPGGGFAVACYFHDISAQVRAGRTIAESEQRFRTLADNISQFAWMADASGWIFWYNQRWHEYTGTTLAEMEGWGWTKVHHPDHVERIVKSFGDCVRAGEPWEETFPLRSKKGEYRWFLSRALPIRDAAGNIQRWFGTNTDVTQQREMADALRQNAADMSESDRRKTEFLAMLAHELRNPLAPIRNALQILKRGAGPEANGQVGEAACGKGSSPTAHDSPIEMMERQVGQMVRLVDDLLDVSRINRGKIDLRRERVELASVISQAVETCGPAIECARHELTVTLPPQPVYLHADPVRLAQVFSNLLNNACKYSEPAGRIWLTAERRGSEVVVTVKDAGVGIAPDMLPRIFDMFSQVDLSLERSQGGLGIGLTLVKNLVELHAGTVEAKSAGTGRGSEFVVNLPLPSETWLAAQGETGNPQTLAAGNAPVAPVRRILVVDDNRDAATSLARLLQLSGNTTHTAFDGLEAVQAAATHQPDVVLLDIGLPHLNGYEACRRIREQPWGKHMALVALTGWGQEDDRQKSKDAGFNAHLVKPVEYAALTTLLGELLPLRNVG